MSIDWSDARKANEYQAMLDNLTECQARCTELLEENRRLRAQLLNSSTSLRSARTSSVCVPKHWRMRSGWNEP